jgi:hypothetical protein
MGVGAFMVKRVSGLGASVCAWALLSSPAAAQEPLPGTAYDPAIPTQEQVLGDAWGARVTAPEDVVAYFRALEAAASDRVVVRPYAESWQGRELVYVVIGSAENIAALDEFDAGMKALADPRETSRAEADALIAELPASVWLAHGVHGDEISSSEAAMAIAYHLLAAEGDPTVDAILANTLVFIDPDQNPDGRARFVHEYYDTLGLEPFGSPIAAERVQRWPGGRVNHYLFDMNRDWLALTQPETVGRIAAYLEHYPLIFVDLHEMGADSTYFFSPEAVPYNPDITQSQRDFLHVIGRNNARWFDRFGFAYFTREVYDAFYPGYGAAWPLFHGSIGTTYEQAGADGLTARRFDGTDVTYLDGARHHFTASLATLETASTNRERLLREFYEYRASAIEEGRDGPIRSYVIPPQADQSTADKLAGLLAMQGIEVGRAESRFRACRADYEPGTYVIRTDQPAGRLVRTLLEPDVALEQGFVEEQERRRARSLGVEIYDVVAWSLPLMFNVEVDRCEEAVGGELAAVAPVLVQPGTVENPEASFAMLAPWGSAGATRLLAAALREGISVSSPDAGFTLGERSYPAGTLIFRLGGSAELKARLTALAAETGADLVGVDDSWVTEGPSFGSELANPMVAPRIALAWDEPADASSAGGARFVIERQLGYPTTPVAVENLASDDLALFDVLILPDGGDYMSALGEDGAAALKGWTEKGGVLIALGGAARFTADPMSGLSALRREETAFVEGAPSDPKESGTVPGTLIETPEDLLAAEAPAAGEPDASPGVLVRGEVSPDSWVSAGVKPTVNVLMMGSDIYAPLKRDEGRTAVSFAGADELLASGYLWRETQLQLARKPFVTVEGLGRGWVITFTQNPTTRAYLDGLDLLLANAIFRGAAHARPAR